MVNVVTICYSLFYIVSKGIWFNKFVLNIMEMHCGTCVEFAATGWSWVKCHTKQRFNIVNVTQISYILTLVWQSALEMINHNEMLKTMYAPIKTILQVRLDLND